MNHELKEYDRYTFQSITEFGHAIKNAPARINGDGSLSNEMDNVFDFDDAVDIAANKGGYWPEGAEGLAKVAIDASVAHMTLKRALKLVLYPDSQVTDAELLNDLDAVAAALRGD